MREPSSFEEWRAMIAVENAHYEYVTGELRFTMTRLAITGVALLVHLANWKWGPWWWVSVAVLAVMVPIAVSAVRSLVFWTRLGRLRGR